MYRALAVSLLTCLALGNTVYLQAEDTINYTATLRSADGLKPLTQPSLQNQRSLIVDIQRSERLNSIGNANSTTIPDKQILIKKRPATFAEQTPLTGRSDFLCNDNPELLTDNTTAQVVGCNNTATTQNYPTPATFVKKSLTVLNTGGNGGCDVILTLTQKNGAVTPITIPANQGDKSQFINKKTWSNVTMLNIKCGTNGSKCNVKYKLIVK